MSYFVFFCMLFIISSSGSVTSVGEERAYLSANVYLLLCGLFWRGFFFLWVHGMGYVILLWPSLGLPYFFFFAE